MASSSSRDLVLRWVGDVTKLVDSTKEVNRVVDKSAKNAEDQGDRAGKGFGTKFSGGIKSVAGKLAAGMGALFAFDKIKDFAKQAYAEAREAQKVGGQTNAVIKSTGGAARVSTKQVANLATAISNKTGIDDEQIQSGQNMLLTFTNLRNGAGKNNKIFDQSTQIMTDMSVATGKDMVGSATMLGKALNNPSKGISALTRVGVTFTDQQQKQIKALQASGDTMGAQKIILGELRKEFGGSAAAQATAGDKIKTTWANFQESIGTTFLPLVDKLLNALSSVFALMTEHKTTVLILAGVIGAVAIAMGAASVATSAYETATTIATAAQWLFNTAMDANPIGLIVLALAALVGGLILAYKHSEKFRKVVDAIWAGITAAAKAVTEWFTNKFLPFFSQTLPGVFQGLLDWVKKHWATILAIITGPVGLAVLGIVKHWSKIKNAFKAVKEWVSGTWRKGWSAVSGWVSGAVGKGRDKIRGIWSSARGHFSKAKEWVSGTWRKGWSGVSGWVSAAVGKGRDKIRGAWSSARGHFTKAKDWVSGTWRKGWSNVKQWVADPVGVSRDRIGNILGKTGVRSKFNTVKEWVQNTWKKGWSKLTGWLTAPITKAATAIGKILGKKGLRKTMGDALDGIGRLWTRITDPIKNAIRSMIKFINLGLIKGGINWLLKKLGVKGSGLVPWIPVPNFKKMASGGRVKGRNAYQRGGTDRIPILGDRDEMMIGRGAVRNLDRTIPGGLDYLNKTGHWPVGPAAETTGAYQNTGRGPGAPVDLSAVPGNLAAIIRRGPRSTDRSGFGGASPMAYANSHVGQMGWYNRCLAFVNAAWNYTVGRFRLGTARQSAMAGPRNMRGMPPAGAGVYWDTGPAGHIALAAGDGSVYSNDIRKAGRIDRVPQQEINKWGAYMGWWHPYGAKGGGAGFNPGGAAGGGGPLDMIKKWIGNLDPIAWLRKKVAGFASKTGVAGGLLGSGLARTLPGMIIDRAKTWLMSKFGGASGGTVGNVKGWDRAQLGNAATIISTARALGFGNRGAQIGLITAMQESTLRNLNRGNADSLGLFQQRAPWGSARDRTTPSIAARMFFQGGRGGQRGLKAFPWRSMGLAQAAQAVQVSAFPSAYAKWIGQSAAMLGKFQTLDQGGYLPTGASVAINRTGRRERVLSPAEEDAIARPIVINVYGAVDRLATAREIRSMLIDLDRSHSGITLNPKIGRRAA